MNSPRRYRGLLPKSTIAVYGSLVERRSREYYIYTDEHEFVRISNRHICLFTGLKDVHGTELYEEDMAICFESYSAACGVAVQSMYACISSFSNLLGKSAESAVLIIDTVYLKRIFLNVIKLNIFFFKFCFYLEIFIYL